jgi:hypothetical protein
VRLGQHTADEPAERERGRNRAPYDELSAAAHDNRRFSASQHHMARSGFAARRDSVR